MKVLEVNAKCLRFCGLSWQNQLTTFDKIWRLAKNVFFLANFIIIGVGSISYMGTHPDSISDWPLLEFVSGLTGFVSYIEILANAKTVKHIFEELQHIVDNGKFINVIN